MFDLTKLERQVLEGLARGVAEDDLAAAMRSTPQATQQLLVTAAQKLGLPADQPFLVARCYVNTWPKPVWQRSVSEAIQRVAAARQRQGFDEQLFCQLAELSASESMADSRRIEFLAPFKSLATRATFLTSLGVATLTGAATLCHLATQPAPVQVSRELFTRRQLEVLEQTALGLSNAQIASTLLLSCHTVKTHLRNASAATCGCSRKALALLFVRHLLTEGQRALWRKKVPFKWPTGRQAEILRFRLAYPDVSRGYLSQVFSLSLNTIGVHTSALMDLLPKPRTGVSLLVAAELHRPDW